MTTIIFKTTELHDEENYLCLFHEPFTSGRTNKEREEGWRFELDDLLIEQISNLCKQYHFERFERETYCIVRLMLDAIARNNIRIPKKIWESKFEDMINDLDLWSESSLLEKVFALGNLEYLKAKQKDGKPSIKYEGPLLDFIQQAILEKIERDKGKLLELRSKVSGQVWYVKDHLKPQENRRDEKYYAYYLFWFFDDQLGKKRLDPKVVNRERIDEFGGELMKLAGYIFKCDNSDFGSMLAERKATFRSWRIEYKKYLNKYDQIP